MTQNWIWKVAVGIGVAYMGGFLLLAIGTGVVNIAGEMVGLPKLISYGWLATRWSMYLALVLAICLAGPDTVMNWVLNGAKR